MVVRRPGPLAGALRRHGQTRASGFAPQEQAIQESGPWDIGGSGHRWARVLHHRVASASPSPGFAGYSPDCAGESCLRDSRGWRFVSAVLETTPRCSTAGTTSAGTACGFDSRNHARRGAVQKLGSLREESSVGGPHDGRAPAGAGSPGTTTDPRREREFQVCPGIAAVDGSGQERP